MPLVSRTVGFLFAILRWVLAGMIVRDREILKMFASGMSYAQIGDASGNKTVSVRNAAYRIQEKLGVHSKQDLVVWAVRNGLMERPQRGGETPPPAV